MNADDVFQQLSTMIANWQTFTDLQREWLDGPDADNDVGAPFPGKRPLSDVNGNEQYTDTPAEMQRRMNALIAQIDLSSSPAALEQRVSDLSDSVDAKLIECDTAILDVQNTLPDAQTALADVQAAQTQLDSLQATLTTLRDDAVAAKNNALIYQQGALNSRNDAQAFRDEIKAQRFILQPNKAAIAATLPADYDLVGLIVPSEAGFFVFDAGDLSSAVAADVTQATYIAPDSDPTGASGAWKRI